MAKAVFLEGTDGSGKSTQFLLLQEYFKAKGIEFVALREPGGSDYYEALRELYLHTPHEHPAMSDALLSAAGRAANIVETRKALEQGKWVLSDRAYPSSYVYQAAQGLNLEDIKAINHFALGDFDYDIKILLDVPVEVAAQRIDDSGTKKDHWESLGKEFFTTIREKYLELAKSENYHVIDSSGNIDSIHQAIIAVLQV